MTVHARGFRTYQGGFRAPPAALAIAKESVAVAWRRKAFKRIGVLYVTWFAMWCFFLYLTLGTEFRMWRHLWEQGMSFEAFTVRILDEVVLYWYFSGLAVLTALMTIFVGSGLISDDLATGALPLYLVRPIRASDYVIGKALVIPALLLIAAVLPGVLFYLLAGFWQPPGETWPFLGRHADILGRVLEHYAVAAGAYTGLALLLSSRTSRRGAAAVLAAVIILGGIMLQHLATEGVIHGGLGDAFLLAGIPKDTVAVFIEQAQQYKEPWDWEAYPSRTGALALAGVLLVAGLVAAWRRARTVEVTG